MGHSMQMHEIASTRLYFTRLQLAMQAPDCNLQCKHPIARTRLHARTEPHALQRVRKPPHLGACNEEIITVDVGAVDMGELGGG